jgi:hypothetical protein
MQDLTPHPHSIQVCCFPVCHDTQGLGMPRTRDRRAIFPCHLKPDDHAFSVGQIQSQERGADDKHHTSL